MNYAENSSSERGHQDQCASGQGVTVIRIDTENSGGGIVDATTASLTPQRQEHDSYRINMDEDTDGRITNTQNNILSSFFNEARTLGQRQSSYPPTTLQNIVHSRVPDLDMVSSAFNSGPTIQESNGASTSAISQSRQVGPRSWRMNLNDVLAFSSEGGREALRSLILHSNSFRYTPLSTTDNSANASDNIHFLLQPDAPSSGSDVAGTTSTSPILRMNARSSLSDDTANTNTNISGMAPQIPVRSAATADMTENIRQNSNDTAPRDSGDTAIRNNTPPADFDDDNNAISNGLVNLLSLLARYLPFICILFVKFIHDHLLGILDLLLLHGIMYQLNKSLREQIAKFSQKSYAILLRDLGLAAAVVACRLLLNSAASTPDPFGLLVTPPGQSMPAKLFVRSDSTMTMPVREQFDKSMMVGWLLATREPPASTPTDPLTNAVIVTKAVSLGVLLYYVAVNDLILKLLTILVKIAVTMLPTKVIRHKPRARMFVLIEYLSQFYRALVPVRQWLLFLFESYSGLEVISGVLFSSFYMGAKGFEFIERGKSLRKALSNFIRNMDYERKPTKEEVDAAGSICPICHDGYTTPVVLECGHIFCDDCVQTWFKREQTCPMCRAKVSDDPAWQDGATSFSYQFC